MYENRTNITWYGTASVRIASGSSQLIIDPFFPFPDSRVKVSDDAYSDCSSIPVSHGHFDHIGSIVREGTVVYCTKTPYRSLNRMCVSKENLRLIHEGSVFSVGDIRITAYNSSMLSAESG